MRKRAFTLIELLVVISIIALLIGILLPALGAARLTARKMQNSTQIRGIHQAMVTDSQANKGWYRGLSNKGFGKDGTNPGEIANETSGNNDVDNVWNSLVGDATDGATSGRGLQGDDFYTEELMLSPGENNNAVSSGGVDPVADATGSYAVLQWSDNVTSVLAADTTPEGRNEWKDTFNSEAPIIVDRCVDCATATTPNSLWSPINDIWQGSIVWNDNHVGFENAADGEGTIEPTMVLGNGKDELTLGQLFSSGDPAFVDGVTSD